MNNHICSRCGKDYNPLEAEELFESEIAGFAYRKLSTLSLCENCATAFFREELLHSGSSFTCTECGGEFVFREEYEKFKEDYSENDSRYYDAAQHFTEEILCWQCSNDSGPWHE